MLARVLDAAVQIESAETVPAGEPLELQLDLRGTEVRLRALWAGDGRPFEVRDAIDDVQLPWPDDLVITAHQLSPGSLALLDELDANWADETGRARIRGEGILVLRDSDRPPSDASFTWSTSALEIAETVLSRSFPEGIGTGQVAELTGWSPAQVTHVLQAFDGRGWSVKSGPKRGPGAVRGLLDSDGLLEAWAKEISGREPELRRTHSLTAPVELLRGTLAGKLDERLGWATTGWVASDVLAPVMSAVPSLQIYVSQDDFFGPLLQAIAESDLRFVDEGGTVEFWAAPPHVIALAQRHEGLPVVSAPRVYADLLRLGGRGEDAAEHLRREVIAPLHRAASAHEG